MHAVVGAVISAPAQFFKQTLGRAALPLRQLGFLLDDLRQNLDPVAKLRRGLNSPRRLQEGAERSEAPRRGDGDPGASAGALASNPLPWWEKLTMDVSLWVRFTATERREGARLTGC